MSKKKYTLEEIFKDPVFLEFEYKSGDAVITQDNVNLYYEFMGKRDKNKVSNILDGMFKLRLKQIKEELNINELLGDDCFKYEMDKHNQVSMDLFGVKDTLKPISEYIEEIKASNEYKEYIYHIDNFTYELKDGGYNIFYKKQWIKGAGTNSKNNKYNPYNKEAMEKRIRSIISYVRCDSINSVTSDRIKAINNNASTK